MKQLHRRLFLPEWKKRVQAAGSSLDPVSQLLYRNFALHL
jgi:hypothetical protein